MSYYVNNKPSTSTAVSSGFSLDAFRAANMVRIYVASDSEPKCIFKAFYQGTFSYNVKLNTDSYGESITRFINGAGPVVRSTMNSIGRSAFGEAWSGAFAMPYKPYVKGTEPLTFDIECILPLVLNGDGTDTFEENIETPIDDLLAIMLPWKSKVVGDITKKIDEKWDEFMHWLFRDDTGAIWKAVQDTYNGWKSDFVGGIYMLNNPVQFDRDHHLILTVGQWRVDGIIIDNVKVEYAPSTYTDGTNSYPAYAKVAVHCRTLGPATPDIMHVFKGLSNAKPFIKEGYIK